MLEPFVCSLSLSGKSFVCSLSLSLSTEGPRRHPNLFHWTFQFPFVLGSASMDILVRRSVSPMERFVTDKSTRFCPTDTAEGTRIGCYSDQHSGITYAVLLICFTEIFTFTISLCLCFEMNAMPSDRGKSLARDTPMHNPLARWQLNSLREPQAHSHPAGTTLRPKFRTQN